jgi:hypothetical protein
MSTTLLFPPLPPPKAVLLAELRPLADCSFLLLPPRIYQQHDPNDPIQLQIRADWVLQMGPEGALLSGFHAELTVKVEIEGDAKVCVPELRETKP